MVPFISLVLLIVNSVPVRVLSQQLDCNHDQNNFCNWSNGVNGLEDDFDWQIGNSVAVDGYHSIPRTVTGTGFFTFAQGKFRPTETETAKAWLRSPTIDGLSRPATLTFNYWKTAAPPVLQVCTRDAGVSQVRCLDTISGPGAQQWTRREVTIPPNPLPFQIIFVATNFRTPLDLVGLDDVQFRTSALDEGKVRIGGSSYSVGRDGISRTTARPYATSPAATPRPVYETASEIGGRTWATPVYTQTQTPLAYKGQQQQQQQRVVEQPQNQQVQQRTLQEWQRLQQQQRNPNAPLGLAPFTAGQGDLASRLVQNGRPPAFTPQQPFRISGPQPEVVLPSDRVFFGPTPLPALPVERAEAESESAQSANQPINSAITPSPARITIPSNGLNGAASSGNDLGTTGTAGTQEQHGHEHNHSEHHHHTEFGVGACQAVGCTFQSSLCNWINDPTSSFEWKLKNNQSQYQGIPQDFSARSSYVFVSGDQRRPDQKAGIRSQPFVAPSGAYLEFFTFVTDSTVTRLSANRITGSDQPNVLWQTLGNGQVERNSWQRVRVPLPASSFPTTLSIVADQLTTGQYIGVDDVRLIDSSGADLGCAADTSFSSLGSTRLFLWTPFPPKEGTELDSRPDLQLSPGKVAALLNNRIEEGSEPGKPLNISTDSPVDLSANRFIPTPTTIPPAVADVTGLRPATVQQRRIGVIETGRSFGGSASDSAFGQQPAVPSSVPPSTLQSQNGATVGNAAKNGHVLNSIERGSDQWNVFQPARPDQLPAEIILASQLTSSPTSPQPSLTTVPSTATSPAAGHQSAAALILPSPASPRPSIEPAFPPGDSPEVNDQDAFYRRKLNSTRSTGAARGVLSRLESNDEAIMSVDGSDNGIDLIRETARPNGTPTPITLSRTTAMASSDPLGFQDFVSSLTRDLQVLAGGAPVTNPWQQTGFPLDNFNYGNSLRPSTGPLALGLQGGDLFQPKSTNNLGWLQSILGKRK